ncbi:MAG: 3-dehydroquinate dehydratase [Alphaproteobacteria bacterium]|nr:3-dehydroquinate dehydratase [Alphaproteobacteria bacterium]MBT5828167.1 3-dehydroquinate dehydratase [Alphaproteobacteria bacterium]
MHNILVINGPNLNLLGKREPEIYGRDSLEKINLDLKLMAEKKGFEIFSYQSNSESKIIDILQEAYLSKKYCAIIINAAAYTHTSIAIYDILKLFQIPIMEVHLSDPNKREEFRHFSYISLVATEIFKGMGNQGYFLALEHIINSVKNG